MRCFGAAEQVRLLWDQDQTRAKGARLRYGHHVLDAEGLGFPGAGYDASAVSGPALHLEGDHTHRAPAQGWNGLL